MEADRIRTPQESEDGFHGSAPYRPWQVKDLLPEDLGVLVVVAQPVGSANEDDDAGNQRPW